MAIFLACFLSFSAAVEERVSHIFKIYFAVYAGKRHTRSPRRPDKRHPTFPILFNTNDFSLGTSVPLEIFDNLSVGAAFSVLDHLVASLLWLC